MRQPFRTVLAAALVVLFVLNQETIGKTVGPSCSVGVTGTAAIMEARGWLGFQACDSVAAQASIATYRYSGQIQAPVVCQYDVSGLRYTVHDEGVLKLVGTTICVYLAQLAAGAGSPTTQLTQPAPPTVAAVSTVAPIRTTAPVSLESAAREVMRTYYGDLQSRQYALAWSMLSTDLQRRQTYTDWVAGYRYTISTRFDITSAVQLSPNSVRLTGMIVATDNLTTPPPNHPNYVRQQTFQTTYDVGLIGASWKLLSGEARLASDTFVPQ